MYSKVKSVKSPETERRERLGHDWTIDPKASSIGSPVVGSGWYGVIMQRRKWVKFGQFRAVAVTAAFVICWQK